jgi:hypothetical protein
VTTDGSREYREESGFSKSAICTCRHRHRPNHEDNVAARKAANVSAGLDAIVIEAMNTALKDDLALIFACKPVTSGNG